MLCGSVRSLEEAHGSLDSRVELSAMQCRVSIWCIVHNKRLLEVLFEDAPLPSPLRNLEDSLRREFTKNMAQTARTSEGLGESVCLRAKQQKRATIRLDYVCDACERNRKYCCRVSEGGLVVVPSRP